jgi:hypothetical protein
VVNIAFFILGDFPKSEFYMPKFRKTWSVSFSKVVSFLFTDPRRCNRQNVPKRRHRKFKSRGITQRKGHNNMLIMLENEIGNGHGGD